VNNLSEKTALDIDVKNKPELLKGEKLEVLLPATAKNVVLPTSL
jgi:hypothetical protein